MKTIYFILLLVKISSSLKNRTIFKFLKCFTNTETITLTNHMFPSDEFTLSMWIRADEFYNLSDFQIFSQIDSVGNSIIINSQKSVNYYELTYDVTVLGNINYGTGLNEIDIDSKTDFYLSWKHLTISYKKIDAISAHSYVYMDILGYKLLNFIFDFNDLDFLLCKNVENPGLLYYADIMIFDTYFSTELDFQSLIFYPYLEIGVFNLLSKDNKNRLFYKNLKSSHISPKLKILKKNPGALAENDVEKFSYQLNFEKKFFEFEIKYYSLINNSYVITTKILLIRPENTVENYCLYSRISSTTNPLENTFTSGKLGFFLKIDNQNLTLNLKLNNIIELTLSDTFYTTTELLISMYISKGINFLLSPNYTSNISNVKIAYNDSFVKYEINKNLDLSIFNYEDKHIFGYSDNLLNNYSNLFFLEYLVRVGQQWNMDAEVFDSLNNDCVVSNFPQFSTKLLNDPDITTELVTVNEGNINSSWCGLVDSPNCDLLGANELQISCFSKHLLYNNDNYHTCQDTFLTENIYYCDPSSLNVINIDFIGNTISTSALNNINTNLFINGIDLGNEFSVIISLDISSQGINFKFQKSFLSLIDKFLTIEFFQYFFINFPQSTFTYKLYWEYVQTSDYIELDLYDICIQNVLFYKESNFISNCVGTCGLEFYKDELDICVKCEDNCLECENSTCLSCGIGYYLYHNICVLTNATCIDLFQNCNQCDLIDIFKCVGCETNYHFIISKDSCGLNCLLSIPNCNFCKVGIEDECDICNNLYSIENGLCVLNCFSDPNAATCDSIDVSTIESCAFGYNVNLISNTCDVSPICYYSDLNCLACDTIDVSKCILCQPGFSLVNFFCEKNCILNENIIECCKKDITLIKICQEDYSVDFINNECVLVCPDNCKECIKRGFEIICIQCNDSFFLNGINCIPDYCISDFCINCETDYTLECEKCLNCDDKEIFFCENILHSCDTCIRTKQEYQCMKCNEGFYLSNNCLETETIIFNNNTITTTGSEVIEKNCLESYNLINGVCDKESNNCDIGCYRCFEVSLICLECNNELKYEKESNKCLGNPTKINILDEPLIKYFDFSNYECNEHFNNITYIKEINETFYQTNFDYEVKKNTEIQNYIVNCRENREECGDLVDEIEIKDFEGCDKVNKIINEVIYNEYTNITYMVSDNYCSNNKEEYFCYDKEINCLNENCTDYKKSKICHKHKNIEICQEKYSNVRYENLKFLEIFNYFEYCQINKRYYMEWRKECRQECEFKLEKKIKKNIINSLQNSKVIFDFNNLKASIPYYINIKYKDRGEKVEIKINEKYKNATFYIQPKHIGKASNCSLHDPIEMNIINDKFFKINPFVLDIVKNFDAVISISIFVLNLIFPQFLTMEIIELLQFNEFFLYLYFLDLDGGSFFNFFSSTFAQKPDNDLFLIKENEYFEYQVFMNKFEKLVISSVINYSLFIFIAVIIFFRAAYHFASPKINKIIRKMTKTSKSEYDKLVGIKRKLLQIKVFLLTVNYKNHIHKFYTVIWDMNLLKIPAYLIIFTWKIKFFFFPINLVTIFYFIFFIGFFFYNFTIIIEYFQLRSFSMSERILIIKNRNFMDENYYLLFQAVIFRVLMIVQIFFIILFSNHTFFVIFFVIFLRILNFSLNIYFSNKYIKKIVYIKIFSLFVFLTWISLVFVVNLMNLTSLNVFLNTTYIMSNILKVFETIGIVFFIRKLKKLDMESLYAQDKRDKDAKKSKDKKSKLKLTVE